MTGFDKLGVISIDASFAADAIHLLHRADLAIVGSMASHPGLTEIVLIVTGDPLPDECRRRPMQAVDIAFRKDVPERGFATLSVASLTARGPWRSL